MKRGVLQKERPTPLKIIKQECPSFNSQKRQPIIIQTYSPQVITVEACNFRTIVQRLTGPTACSPPPPKKKLKPSSAEEPSLISIESPQSERTASFNDMSKDWLDYQGDSQSYRNLDSEGNPNPYGIPNCDTDGNANQHGSDSRNGAFNTDCSRNPNPNSALSTSARTTVLPPFVKPSPFLSHCGSFKQSSCLGEPFSPFSWSPSLFDLSPSRLPSPSTFLAQLSPFPAAVVPNDSTSFVS